VTSNAKNKTGDSMPFEYNLKLNYLLKILTLILEAEFDIVIKDVLSKY